MIRIREASTHQPWRYFFLGVRSAMGVTARTADRAPLSVKNMPTASPAIARSTPMRFTGNAMPPRTNAREPLIESGKAALCAVSQLSSDSRVYFVRMPVNRFRLIRPSAQRNATTQVTKPANTKNAAGKSNRLVTHPAYADGTELGAKPSAYLL